MGLPCGARAADDLSRFATFVVEPKDIAHVDEADDGGFVDLVLLPTKAHELQSFTERHVGKIVIFRWKQGTSLQKSDRATSQLIREPITNGVIPIKNSDQPPRARAQPSIAT